MIGHIHIDIIPQEQTRQMMLSIASDIYKPDLDDPKFWLISTQSLAEIVNSENNVFSEALDIEETLNEPDFKPIEFDGFVK